MKITIKETRALKPGDPQCITLFNLINRRAFQTLEYRQLGRHFYNPKDAHMIEKHKCVSMPGLV